MNSKSEALEDDDDAEDDMEKIIDNLKWFSSVLFKFQLSVHYEVGRPGSQ
jgi:hypothetical protein